jgi:peroxiredoxin
MKKMGQEKMGQHAPDFELPGIDDGVHHLAKYLEKYQAIGVVIMCNHCPYVHLYLDRLKQLQTRFQSQGFTLIGINANDDQQYPADSFEKMKAFAQEKNLNFPYLRDVTQDVAQSFGAQRTPELFLLNASGVICYSGAIDDNPQDPAAVKVHYAQDAIAQLLAQDAIAQSTAPAVGCSVKWRA